MPMTTANGNQSFLPTEVGSLVVQPTLALSVAAQVCTVVQPQSREYRIPIVSDDPTAAWVAEGDEITPSDATFDEIVVTPGKLAGLTIISRELANDTDPEAAAVVGQGLARDLARKVDEAFFADGTQSPAAPAGLGGLTSGSTVATYDPATPVDAFEEAVAVAAGFGANLTAWVASPARGLELAKAKTAANSHQPLLQPDPTQPTRRLVAGRPVYVSPQLTEDVIWGVSAPLAFLVVRQGVTLDVDRSAYFSSDRIGIRATMRVGFGFPHQPAIVKITVPA